MKITLSHKLMNTVFYVFKCNIITGTLIHLSIYIYNQHQRGEISYYINYFKKIRKLLSFNNYFCTFYGGKFFDAFRI